MPPKTRSLQRSEIEKVSIPKSLRVHWSITPPPSKRSQPVISHHLLHLSFSALPLSALPPSPSFIHFAFPLIQRTRACLTAMPRRDDDVFARPNTIPSEKALLLPPAPRVSLALSLSSSFCSSISYKQARLRCNRLAGGSRMDAKPEILTRSLHIAQYEDGLPFEVCSFVAASST